MKRAGLLCDFDFLSAGLQGEQEGLLQAQDAYAEKAFTFVAHLLRYRCSSMAWHSRSFPGLLALFARPEEEKREEAYNLLKEHWDAFQAAKARAGFSITLDKFVQKSPFSGTVLREVGELAFQTEGVSKAEVLEELAAFASLVFSSLGQTKLVEDGFQRLRSRERDTASKTVKLLRAFNALKEQNLLNLHQRRELDPTGAAPGQPEKATNALFSYVDQDTSFDATGLCQTATWPTMGAQASQCVQTEAELLRFCHQFDCWDKVDAVWRSALVPPGTVLMNPNTQDHWLVLGATAGHGLWAWPLLEVACREDEFILVPEAEGETSLYCLFVYTWDDFHVVPTAVISPARQFTQQGYTLSEWIGISLAGPFGPGPHPRTRGDALLLEALQEDPGRRPAVKGLGND